MKELQEIDGMIGLGYDAPDYSKPIEDGKERETVTRYPCLRVCGEAAAELHTALSGGRCLDGEFAAVVVLKNIMVRVSDEDEDEEESKDVELEFKVYSIMPDLDKKNPKLEEEIMSDFEKLPRAKKDNGDEELDGDDSGESY
jgi:hypothetical protein